jgi:hypothetical protein
LFSTWLVKKPKALQPWAKSTMETVEETTFKQSIQTDNSFDFNPKNAAAQHFFMPQSKNHRFFIV